MSSTPFNFFDKIFCINLPHRVDRWENSQETFKALNINNIVNRFEGYNALEENRNKGVFSSYFYFQEPDTIGTINLRRSGCAMSFIKIIQTAKQNQYKNVLIFEDDIIMHASVDIINSTLTQCIEELPNNWELFYLSANPTTFHGHVTPVTPYSANLCTIHAAFCCHAIAINSNIYDTILSSYYSHPDIFDWVLKNVNFDTFCLNYIQPKSKSYMPKKLLFTQYTNFSDIENCVRPNSDFILQSYQTFKHLLV